MTISFLIGNGFDLNLGLNTTFSSFLDCYTKENANDTEMIERFKKSILKDKKRWSDAEIAFGEYTEVFRREGKSADDYYECYDDFCEQLAKYLETQEKRIDFGSQSKETAEAFSKSISISNILSNQTEVQQNQLTSSFENFGEGFHFNFIDFNYTTTLDSCISHSRKYGGILGERVYSHTRYSNSISNLIHVHGYTSRSMVLGVNDIGQLADAELFSGFGEEYVDQLIKIKANGLNEENTDRKAAEVIKQSDLIYIYGMSLGDTDKLWWGRIMQRMIQQPNMHLIIHSHSAPKTALLPRKNRTWVNRTKNAFIEKAGKELTEDQRKTIFERIHIDGKNIFEPLKDLKVHPDIRNISEARPAVV